MHVLAIIGRVAAGCVAALAFYMAFFMYEDEQGEWQNRLDDFWVKIHDRAKSTDSVSVALVNKVAEIFTAAIDRLVGRKLLSFRAFIASLNLSLFILMLILGLVFAMLSRTLSSLGISFIFFMVASIAIAAVLCERRWIRRLCMLPLTIAVLMLFSETAYQFARFKPTRGYSLQIAGETVAASILLAIISDFMAIIVIRRVLRRLVTRTSIMGLLISLGMMLVLGFVVISPVIFGFPITNWLTRHLLTKSHTMVVFTLGATYVLFSVASFNYSTALLCILPTAALFGILIHKLMWPFLGRMLYPLCRFSIVTNRYALLATGSLFLTGAVYPAALDLERVLKYFG